MTIFTYIVIAWFVIGFIHGLYWAIFGELILDEGLMSRIGTFFLGLVLGPVGVVMSIIHELNHRV